jgi:LysR family transcriptional regulator, transcriptional activator for aaeXAB operon
MDPYRRMAILVAVVDNGSLRGAARELELTPSAVSQQLARLEAETGATLLTRTTRRLALTEAGEAFYASAAAMVAAAREARERVAALRTAPAGHLAIGVPSGFAASHLAPALAPLLASHPSLRLRVVVGDERPDPIRDRLDFAIAIGPAVPSSTLVRRHLARWEMGLCASPAYIARRGAPTSPASLSRHDVITLPRWHHGADVLVRGSGRPVRLRFSPRATADDQSLVRRLTVAGAGLSFQALPEVAEELRSGALVRVLSGWSGPPLSVDALMPRRAEPPASVRLALAALEAHLSRREAAAPRARRRG